MEQNKFFDVIIVGGSYAGLSAAMSLGRSLKKVLIIDSGLPCNRQTPHSHNFITQDGEVPGVIAEKAKAQVLWYDTVSYVSDIAVSGIRSHDVFEIHTQSGQAYTGRKLIFATGIKDLLPEIKGFSACWGISIVHCPYCHGYELRGKKTGILANGERAFHLASLVKNLTEAVTILPGGKPDFTAQQVKQFEAHQIQVLENTVAEIIHENGYLRQILLQDGQRIEFDALYAAVPFMQHSDIPVKFGCELNEQGYLKVDAFNKTTVEGIYACGDNSSMMRSVANAVYTGNLVGAIVNKVLTDENF